MGEKIDLEELRTAVELKSDPFDFYLFLVLNNNGQITSDNPFADNIEFLKKVLYHFEAEENFDKCAEIRRSIRDLV